MSRFPLWQLAGVVVAGLLLAAALLPIIERVGEAPAVGVATASLARAPSAPSVAASSAAATTPRVLPDHQRIYLPRAGLPPVSVHVDGIAIQPTPEQRIRSRLDALNPAKYASFPGPLGAFNPFPLADPSQLHVTTVAIHGDLALVDYALPDGGWRVTTADQAIGLRQELVYTATEEPGIRRVQITVNGGKPSPLPLDGPLTREQVFGYASEGSLRSVRGFGERGGPQRAARATHSVDEVAPGLTRFVVEIDQPAGQPTRMYPDWNVNVSSNPETFSPDGGKWQLTVEIYGGVDAKQGVEVVDRSPLRSVTTGVGFGGTPLVYVLALDDLRPWRTALLFDPVRVVVDIGGHPSAVAPTTAVYGPRPGDVVSWMFSVSGVASAFEAHVDWRVRDPSGRIVSSYGTTGTNGEAGGVYETIASVPESFVGRATLEVFQTSGKDGSDAEVVRVPIEIRPTGGIASPPAIPTALFHATGGPYRDESDAVRQSTYLLRGSPTYEVQRTTYALLAQQQGIRTYQIDPGREIYLVRVDAPMELPLKCSTFVKVVDAPNGYERGTLCGDVPWPSLRR
ncbi:MAG TPA: Gmad2 immunoglobulin-like domain-containing protein [Candidatus Limnocylindria bacterium]|nr:Gmad2 immunoglobulin-like domain-containing protein [Candidatus Limnocylindria bacterium]